MAPVLSSHCLNVSSMDSQGSLLPYPCGDLLEGDSGNSYVNMRKHGITEKKIILYLYDTFNMCSKHVSSRFFRSNNR
jgi:hypothetical protein